ncbi:MAG TPA: O-antigen ligase family protein, partial [Atribacterota bacterium]|nr:O-antigen ligase family protein [Atribacterota bacterium]
MEQEELTLPKFNQSIWTDAIEVVIITMIVLIPTIFYPRVIDIFHPIKTLTFSLLVIIGLTLWGFNVLKKEEFKIISNPLNIPVLSFIIICVLSLIWSDSPFISLKELPLFLAGPLLYFIIVNNIYNERQINRIIGSVLIVGALFGIYGILQYNGIDFSFWIGNYGRGKVFGLFGNAGYFAGYLMFPLPIAIALFFVCNNKIKKILLLIAILAMSGALLATLTRGSYLALGISSIIMFLLFLSSHGSFFIKENKKIFTIILIAVLVTTFLLVIPSPLNKQGSVISKIKSRISVTQLSKDSSLKRREAIWGFSTLMIKDRPLLGSGLGTFKYNTLRYQAKFFDLGQNRTIYPYGIADKAHNEYLQLGAELGLIGLGIFLWLIISYFNFGIKKLRCIENKYKQGIIIGLMGSVVAFLVDGLFWFPLRLPTNTAMFWLVLGLTVVTIKTEVNADKTNLKQKDFDIAEKKVENISSDKKQKKAEDKDSDNIYRFKPLLYLSIILLVIILSITIARPLIAQTYWYKGFKEIEKENWDNAIKIYEEALRWDPYLGPIYYDIGKILQNKNLYGVAREYLEKAEKYIDHPDLPLDLAINYLKSGKLDEAAIKLKQAISYQPDEKSMLPVYAELGNTYLQLKRYKPAEIAFKNVLKINSNYVNAHYGLAGAYLNQNKIVQALAELQKVIELAPDSQEANYAQSIIQQIAQ